MRTRMAFTLALLFCFTGALLARQSGKTLRAVGRVTAVAQDAITVTPGASTLTFTVDASTKVTGKGGGHEDAGHEGGGQGALDHRPGG